LRCVRAACKGPSCTTALFGGAGGDASMHAHAAQHFPLRPSVGNTRAPQQPGVLRTAALLLRAVCGSLAAH
jgi:hypothetical protein